MIHYCVIATYKHIHMLRLAIEIASPYVDDFIIVEDGTFPPSVDLGNKVVLLHRKWDNNHVAQRNVYINYVKQHDPEGWCLVMDTDEFPSKQLLESLRSLTSDVYDGYATPSHDIRVPSVIRADPVERYFFKLEDIVEDVPPNSEEPPDDVKLIMNRLGLNKYWFARQFSFRKLNLFRVHPDTQYVGTVHEALQGQRNVKPIDLPYYHLKSMYEVHESGARNYIEGGSGLNLGDKNPHWVELKKCNGGKEINWHEFKYSAPILVWMYNHINDHGHDWSSETYDLYVYLRSKAIIPFRYDEHETHYLDIPNAAEVRRLYHLIYNREPDPEGLRAWAGQWYKLPWDEFLDKFIDSDEYRMKAKRGVIRVFLLL